MAARYAIVYHRVERVLSNREASTLPSTARFLVVVTTASIIIIATRDSLRRLRPSMQAARTN